MSRFSKRNRIGAFLEAGEGRKTVVPGSPFFACWLPVRGLDHGHSSVRGDGLPSAFSPPPSEPHPAAFLSFTYSLTYSLPTHSFIHLFIHSFSHSFVGPLDHSCTHSFAFLPM